MGGDGIRSYWGAPNKLKASKSSKVIDYYLYELKKLSCPPYRVGTPRLPFPPSPRPLLGSAK